MYDARGLLVVCVEGPCESEHERGMDSVYAVGLRPRCAAGLALKRPLNEMLFFLKEALRPGEKERTVQLQISLELQKFR